MKSVELKRHISRLRRICKKVAQIRKSDIMMIKTNFMEDVMAKEIQAKDTTRAMAYEFWMKAPNPMVTFFKTLDVTNLIKISKSFLS